VRTLAKIIGYPLGILTVPIFLGAWFILAWDVVLAILHGFGVEDFIGFTTGPLSSGDGLLLVVGIVSTGLFWVAGKLLEYARVI
jgi:hypothetical protein